MEKKKIIGRAEYTWLVDHQLKKVPARIDTGASTSSIWASDIEVTPKGLAYKLFGKSSELYTGVICIEKRYSETMVASSNGHTQRRYKVPMTIQVKGRRIKTFVTLADRSTQAYPLLIGRNTLKGKFIVDVQNGSHKLDILDRERSNKLQSQL